MSKAKKKPSEDEFLRAVRKGLRTKLGVSAPAKKAPAVRDEPEEKTTPKRFNYAT